MNKKGLHSMVGVSLILMTLGLPSAAEAGGSSPISQGRTMFGLVLGGGSGFFAVGGEAGYFVLDGLRPSLAVVYKTQTSGRVTSTEVETTGGLRYYFGLPDMSFYPFVEGDLGGISLSYEIEGVEDSFFFYRAGTGGGVLAMLNDNFGLEVSLGVEQFFGVDSILTDLEIVPEGLNLRYNFGFSLSI